jgi:hypothetical protein
MSGEESKRKLGREIVAQVKRIKEGRISRADLSRARKSDRAWAIFGIAMFAFAAFVLVKDHMLGW